jgi:hypothetical protein
VDIPITTGLGLTGAFTIALWAKATYLIDYPYLLEFTNDANGVNRQWFFQGSDGGRSEMYMWSDANSAWNKGLGFKEGGGSTADTERLGIPPFQARCLQRPRHQGVYPRQGHQIGPSPPHLDCAPRKSFLKKT